MDADEASPMPDKNQADKPLERLLSDVRMRPDRNLLNCLDVTDPWPTIWAKASKHSGATDALLCCAQSTEEWQNFSDWSKNAPQLLWLRGGVGHGKTLLLTKYVQTLLQPYPASRNNRAQNCAFFSFDSRFPEWGTPADALRMIIWMLLVQQPCLEHHLRNKRDALQRERITDPDDFVALATVFHDIVEDRRFNTAYIVVDAVDRCFAGTGRYALPDFMLLVTESIQRTPNLRWVLSYNDSNSRSMEPWITSHDSQHFRLDPESPDWRTVITKYAESKLTEVAKTKSYDDELRETVINTLCGMKPVGFVWVDAVCRALLREEARYTAPCLNTLSCLTSLDLLYGHMWRDVDSGYDCVKVMITMAVVDTALDVDELGFLSDLFGDVRPETIVGKCGAFLHIQENRASFVHPSARDYIRGKVLRRARANSLKNGLALGCLEFLTKRLPATSYSRSLSLYGYTDPHPDTDEPRPDRLHYSSIHWMRHLPWSPGHIGD
jgi:hypothetical protein